MHTHLQFRPCSWCHVHLDAPLGPEFSGFILVYVCVGDKGVNSELWVAGVLYWENYEIHVDVSLFLSLESMWGHFDMFANTLLYLCSFFIHLQLHVTSTFTIYGAFLHTLDMYFFSFYP